MMDIFLPVMVMTGLGLTFGLGLASALKVFGIEVDPTVALIISKLPGANCGACGKPGCSGFAEALRKGEAVPSDCVVSDDDTRRSVAEVLGIKYKAKTKMVATLLCNGGNRALDKFSYRGIRTCKAASLIFGGYKACSYGCLGFGDCVRACPFDALKMGPYGLPEVDLDKCTACGNCARACPKGLIVLTPIEKKYYVKCSSKEPGGAVMQVCKVGCIACRKCEKDCPIGAIKVEENLARIDYDKCQNIGKCFEVCPTKVITKR